MADKMKELYMAEFKAKMTQINQRLTMIENPKSVEQVVTHVDSILLLIDQMKDIQKVCPDVGPPPTFIIPMIQNTKEIRITELALKTAELDLEKARVVSKPATKAGLLDKAKMMIVEAKAQVRDPDKLAQLDAKMAELNSIE